MLAASLARDYPAAAEQLAGMAHGAGLGRGPLLLLNALEPLLSNVRGRYLVPGLGGCSCLAVSPQRSGIGEPVVARNFDYLPLVQPFYVLRDNRPEGGLRSLDFTMAPLAGTVDGVNERGLCLVNNYAFTIDRARPSGTLTMLSAEALARCATVAEAIAWITSRPRWGGGLVMLADAAGDLASLELSATRFQVRRPAPGAGVLCHTNAFATPQMQAVEAPRDAVFTRRAPRALRGRTVGESAAARDERFAHLLAAAPQLDPAALARLMSDHGPEGQPGALTPCVHGDYWSTTATLQLFPRSRRLRVSYSSACTADFAEFAL
jgi:hypothetical protein